MNKTRPHAAGKDNVPTISKNEIRKAVQALEKPIVKFVGKYTPQPKSTSKLFGKKIHRRGWAAL